MITLSISMKKVIEYTTYEEDIYICPDCLAQCDYGSNDIDGYYQCRECEKTDFTGDIHVREAKLITETLTYYDYELPKNIQ